jgi:hypothetical protein
MGQIESLRELSTKTKKKTKTKTKTNKQTLVIVSDG